MNRRYYILTLLLFWAGTVFAQNARFTASVSRDLVAIGEEFDLTLAANGNGEGFTPPNLNGFRIISGPNLSQSITSINGVTTVQMAYSYTLIAIREGFLTIGPASLTVSGVRLNSNVITISAVRGRMVRKNAPPDARTLAATGGDLSKSLFIRADVDKRNVYQGEQLTVTYKLYTRIAIEQSQPEKLPDLNGFWSEDIKSKQQQAQWRLENYQGLQYNVTDIKQTILFPEHAGNLTIDPLSLVFIVRQPVISNDPMDQFFGDNFKEVKYVAKSLPVVIHARPLPLAGKPENYTGALGKFKIEASVDKTELKADESLNYTVKVTGSGNIKLLKDVNAVFPAGFEKYDPKITDTTTETATGVSGTRMYNYLLIPRHEGNYEIAPVKFSYFNPAENRYTTITTKSFKIKVNKGIAEKNVAVLADRHELKVIGKDIRYIKTGGFDLHKQGDDFFGSPGYYFLLLIGPVFSIAAFQYRKYIIRKNSDIVLVKSRKAAKEAAKRLANAQRQLKANNATTFYEEIFKGLYGYLSNKLNIPYANLDRETIILTLQERSIHNELIDRLSTTLDLCELARYAPVANVSMQQVFEQAKGVINDIEINIK